jgi:predicted transcriptional regulator
VEKDILRYLGEQPETGDEICRQLAAEPAAFKTAARNLWIEGLIQGQLADGCCSTPCGTMCVSAMKTDRVWQLSKKGRMRLKVLAAKGESI